MTINGDSNPDNSFSISNDDIEDDTYVPSPRARPHGKGLASASGSGRGKMMRLRKRLRNGLMVMMVKRKMCLM
jgi:hypothetical protein